MRHTIVCVAQYVKLARLRRAVLVLVLVLMLVSAFARSATADPAEALATAGGWELERYTGTWSMRSSASFASRFWSSGTMIWL